MSTAPLVALRLAIATVQLRLDELEQIGIERRALDGAHQQIAALTASNVARGLRIHSQELRIAELERAIAAMNPGAGETL